MTPAAAQAILRRTIPARLPVLLAGAPGVGKTAIVQALASELGLPLVVSHPVTADPTDFRGLPWMVGGQATFLPIGDLARLADLPNRPALWLIDDLGQALPATQAAVMQLVHRDGRALNGFRLPDSVAIVACTNRPHDRAGVATLLAPLLSRFTTVLTIEPDPVAFVHWALLDLGLAADELLEPFTGALSPPIAVEFLAFLRVYQSLPNADLVRADPDRAPVPDTLDALYATAVHLAVAASPADFALFCRYLQRLPPELQFLFMITAIAKHPPLAHTAPYITWATRPESVAILS